MDFLATENMAHYTSSMGRLTQLFLGRFRTKQLEKADCPNVDPTATLHLRMIFFYRKSENSPAGNAMNPGQSRKALLYPPLLLRVSGKSSFLSLLYCSQSKDYNLCTYLVLLLVLV